MDIINLLPNFFLSVAAIIAMRVIAFVLDLPIINYWFALDRERRKVAEELKLSLTSDKDRETINKEIALRGLGGILLCAYVGCVIYFILIPDIIELLNLFKLK